MSENTAVPRYNLSGIQTHTDYYNKHGQKVGSSADRTDLSGKYHHTDNYDKHGRKTGTSSDPQFED